MSGDNSTAVSFYPRIYRPSRGWFIGLTLCGFLLSAGGIAGAFFFATQPLHNPQSRTWLVSLFILFGLLGLYCLLSTFRSRVVLFPDRIEVEELTRTVVLSREEIRGWRYLPTSPVTLLLVPRDKGRRPVKVAQVFRQDAEFTEWLYTLPSLDREDARASKGEIRNNIRLGATPGERMKSVAKGRRFGNVVTAVAVVVMLWGFLWPFPYAIAISVLAVLPWIALELVRRSGGLFRVDSNQNDAHPTMALPFLFPSLVLMFRSVTDFNIIPSPSAAWLSIGVGGLLLVSAFLVDPSLRGSVVTTLAVAALCLVYGYGAGIEANTLLDRSVPMTYAVRVEAKRIVKYKGTKYEVDLGPWGPKTKPSKLQVSRATYEPIQPGDTVILALRRGALGVRWYYMQAWQRGDAR